MAEQEDDRALPLDRPPVGGRKRHQGAGRGPDGVVFPAGKAVVWGRTEAVHGHTRVGLYDGFAAIPPPHVD
jgi:hypothetical protein